MPVDRSKRDRIANAIAAYLRGEIDNFALGDQIRGLDTNDNSLCGLSLMIWSLYDDVRRHTVHASPEDWNFLIRCVAYLRTDLEFTASYEAPANCCPFPSDELWLAHRLVDDDRIPSYDPERHACKFPARAPRGALIVAAALALLFLAFVLHHLR
jgi:hypothetical protein